ncbi:Ppx/GppA phosphatase [Chloroherpeton thalassium ATCC 35110]|uniref:Ppx/GppA phosphatase n=1 Tax=Chloroherpeton thalassium (strain ATCC 35110 / GB-78) TaxID=517418 RepID=B3QYJ8_CHLT3|nr:Ppx/GppA phosphatase family protein [Chloroherpeton thalassium]ACF13626.1 Ppx/GppA phosphatase [Chloroherpeton thalassium ATCC 35110]
MILQNEQKPLRLAAIDMGTNSFHMVIVEVLPDLGFLIIDRAKDMIRIGESSITTKQLSPKAMEQGIQSLITFRKLAEQRGVNSVHIIAFATSAIREAQNGAAYMKQIADTVGIKTRIISGEEEARLIYLGVRNAIDIGSKKAFIFDIGGGSVEFITGDGRRPNMLESRKLGVARMYERFVTTDPIELKERHLLEQYFNVELEDIAKFVNKVGFDIAIASSGTIENIARMIFLQNGMRTDKLNGQSFSVKDFKRLAKQVIGMKSAARREIPGLDPKRVDLIIPGLLLVCKITRMFNIKDIVVSESALREGMIIDYLSTHFSDYRKTHYFPNIRRRSVIELGRRFQWDKAHASHVALLATKLFKKLQELHKLGDSEQELLEYAALLHNVGCFISMSKHHKHSHYVIMNGGLRGFHPNEIEIIANAVRYHRKSPPSEGHENFKKLSSKEQQIVRHLSEILRVANSLDRGHRQNVTNLDVEITAKKILLKLETHIDSEIEVWSVEREENYFEELFQRKLEVSIL